MTSARNPAIPDMVSTGIQALAKIAELSVYEGAPGNAFQELMDRASVVQQVHVLREALMGISVEHGRQLSQRTARDESFEVACEALIAISEHNLPEEDDIREFSKEGNQACVRLAYDATATIGNLLAAADEPRKPMPSSAP